MPLGDCLLNVAAKLEPPLTSERTNFSRSTFATTSLQSETLLISQCGQMGPLFHSWGAAASTSQRKVSCGSPFG
jgi:hypothetical protein